jgi:hypothetical protein
VSLNAVSTCFHYNEMLGPFENLVPGSPMASRAQNVSFCRVANLLRLYYIEKMEDKRRENQIKLTAEVSCAG